MVPAGGAAMNRLLVFFLSCALAGALLPAQTEKSGQKSPSKVVTSTRENAPNGTLQSSRERTLTGRLVDADCQQQDRSACPVTTDTKNYGLVVANRRFVKFDEGGNGKVRNALKSRSQQDTAKPPRATVTGTLTSDTFNLESIRFSGSAARRAESSH
jgi:hypothetical protein